MKIASAMLMLILASLMLLGCTAQVPKPPVSFADNSEQLNWADVLTPKLLSPKEGALMDNGRSDGRDSIVWDFAWSPIDGASEYRLYVYNGTQAWPLIDRTVNKAEYHFSSPGFIYPGTAFWQVRAKVGGAWSLPSAVGSFQVEAIDSDAPNAPNMQAPATQTSPLSQPGDQDGRRFSNDGLIAYYPLNGNTNDQSGYFMHGTRHGTAWAYDRFGNFGLAISFDGVDDYVDFGNDHRLNLQNALSIAAWVNVVSYVEWAGVLSKGGWGWPAPYLSYALDTKAGGYFKFTLRWGEDTVISKPHQTLTWYHVVCTWDGTTARIFVNGLLENLASFGGTLNVNSGIMAAGVDHPGGVEYFRGSLDEIRLYNRALTEGEVKSLYDAEKP